MKKLVLATAAAVAAFAVAPVADAAQFLIISGPSGTFGDDTVGCATGVATPCGFSRTFTFATPTGFTLASATLSSVIAGANALTNIDFGSVTLNGVNFAIASTGDVEFRSLLNQTLVTNGTNTIQINGTTGGDGSFGGTLSFAASAVPEPAAWAMMIGGFGMIGGSLRRRAKPAASVDFA